MDINKDILGSIILFLLFGPRKCAHIFYFGMFIFPWRTLLGRTKDLLYFVNTRQWTHGILVICFRGRWALSSFLAVHQVVFQGFLFSPRRWFSRPDGPYFLTEFFGSKKEEVCCWSWTGWPVLPNRMLRHQRGEEDCCWSLDLGCPSADSESCCPWFLIFSALELSRFW